MFMYVFLLNSSLPVFDSKGQLISYDVGRPDATIKTLQTLVLKRGWPMELALPLSTANPARFLGMTRKGNHTTL
jgi:beta-aspartyl-dipeptidase (metallo-type)